MSSSSSRSRQQALKRRSRRRGTRHIDNSGLRGRGCPAPRIESSLFVKQFFGRSRRSVAAVVRRGLRLVVVAFGAGSGVAWPKSRCFGV